MEKENNIIQMEIYIMMGIGKKENIMDKEFGII